MKRRRRKAVFVLSLALSGAFGPAPGLATASELPTQEERYSDPPKPDRSANASVEKLTMAIAANPESAAAWTNLGWRLYRSGRYAEAQWAMGAARQRDPKDPYVLWLSGLASYAMGDYDEARTYLLQLYSDFRTWPATVDMAITRELLGRIAFLNGDLTSAAVHFSAASELDPRNWQIHFLRGLSQWYGERYGDALESFETAHELKPGNALVTHYYASARLATDERHLAYARAAVEQDLFADAQAEAEEARRAYLRDQAVVDAAIEADPDNPGNYELLGRYLRSLGRTSEAISAFRQAMSLSPQGAGPPYLLAKTLLETGSDAARREAKLLLMQSVARDPTYWEGSNVAPNGGALVALLLEEGNIDQAQAIANWVDAQIEAEAP